MTASLFLSSYRDGVDVAALLLACTTPEQTVAFWGRTMQGFIAANGPEYADAVAQHARALVDGVDAMRKGVVP
jgi:tRNA pseudouridine-54 N-methylase